MNALVPQERRAPVEAALKVGMQQAFRHLPDFVSQDDFKRTVLFALNKTPALYEMQPQSVVDGCIRAAMDGLLLDNKEAALIPHFDRIQGGKVARYSPMIAGLYKLAMRSGAFRSITVQAVYKNDEFSASFGTDAKLIHRPEMLGERGPMIGAYSYVEFTNGGSDFEVMSKADIDKVRRAGGGKSPAWENWEDQMACKAVFRRHFKRLPLELPQMMTALEHDNDGYSLAAPADPMTIPAQLRAENRDTGDQSQAEEGLSPHDLNAAKEIIGEPNIDRESFDAWLVQDLLFTFESMDLDEAKRLEPAILSVLEDICADHPNWGASTLENWRDTVRDALLVRPELQVTS